MENRNRTLIDKFAIVLQAQRRAQALSQEELAHRSDVSTSYLSLLENRRRQPTLTVMAALARELGLTLSEFVQKIEAAE